MNFNPGNIIKHPKTGESYLVWTEKQDSIICSSWVQNLTGQKFEVLKSEFEGTTMSEWKVGDKFTWSKKAVDSYIDLYWRNPDGTKITEKDIFEVTNCRYGYEVYTKMMDTSGLVIEIQCNPIEDLIKVESRTPKIGDKFKLKEEIAQQYSDNNYKYKGLPITKDTIFEIQEYNDRTFPICVQIDYKGNSGLHAFNLSNIILIDSTKAELECKCNSFDLANHGCKCGFVAEMKRLGKDW